MVVCGEGEYLGKYLGIICTTTSYGIPLSFSVYLSSADQPVACVAKSTAW